MSIILFAIIGAYLDVAWWYWLCFGIYAYIKSVVFIARLFSECNKVEED